MKSFKLKSIFWGALTLAATFSSDIKAQESQADSQTERVMFMVSVAKGDVVNDSEASLLKSKIERAIIRSGAMASGVGTPFVVTAELTEVSQKTSEGLVRDVSSYSGELILKAVNAYNGAIYFTSTQPLSTANAGKADAVTELIKSIKPTDATFVRFVRSARKAIDDYFTTNCTQALNEAVAMAVGGDFDMAYLMAKAIPSSAPCYFDAVELVDKFRPRPAAPAASSPTPAEEPSPTAEPVPEPVAEPVSEPTPEPAPEAEPAPEPIPAIKPQPVEPAPTPVVEAPKSNGPLINVSNPKVSVKGISAEYDTSARRITFTLNVVAAEDLGEQSIRLQEVINADGESIERLGAEKYYTTFPAGINRKMVFYADGVNASPGELPFVKFSIGSKCVIEVRNLPMK